MDISEQRDQFITNKVTEACNILLATMKTANLKNGIESIIIDDNGKGQEYELTFKRVDLKKEVCENWIPSKANFAKCNNCGQGRWKHDL